MKTTPLMPATVDRTADAPWREQAAALIAGAFFFLAPTQIDGPIGTLIVVLQLGLAGLLVVVSPQSALKAVSRWWPLLALPLVTLASALWSTVPDVSARYGAQFLFTCFVGATLALSLPLRTFLAAFVVATLLFCLASIASHNYGASATGPVLIGLTGSKNQMGNIAQIGLLAATVVLMSTKADMRLRLTALALAPIAAYLLWQANAATPLILAVLGFAAVAAYGVLIFLPPAGRAAAVVGLVLVALPMTALIPEGMQAATDFATNALKKDPTLTGRTYLWEKADELIQRRPVLGYGYKSIWVGNSSETIGLLRWAGIEDGRTFHFHDTYRQVRVDTGLIGLVALVLTLVATGIGQLGTFFLRPNMASSFFFVFFLTTLIRSPTEVFLNPFAIQTILLYACAIYSVKGMMEAVASVQQHYERPPMRAAVSRP